jgi:hypothetical protein
LTRSVSRGPLFIASAAVTAAALTIVLAPDTRMERLAQLDFAASQLPQTYLMFSRGRPDRCRVQDRRESTTRRGDSAEQSSTWSCERLPYPGSPSAGWFVQSTKHGRGTLLFVPVYAVDDWTYPYFYAFTRAHEPELDLPRVRWTQVFVDRLYHGLYLEVALPFDLRAADGGSGSLRSIVTVPVDGRVRVLNTRLQEGNDAYGLQASRSEPLRMAERSPALSRLAALRPDEQTYLMSNLAPYELSQLPMPASLTEIYEAKSGRTIEPLAPFDASKPDLAPGSTGHATEIALEADAATARALREGFDEYAARLAIALRLEAAYQDSAEVIRASARMRQTASMQLGFPALELR